MKAQILELADKRMRRFRQWQDSKRIATNAIFLAQSQSKEGK